MIAMRFGARTHLHGPGLEALRRSHVDRWLAGDVEDRRARHVHRVLEVCPVIDSAVLTPGPHLVVAAVDLEGDVELPLAPPSNICRDATLLTARTLPVRRMSGEASMRISTAWPG